MTALVRSSQAKTGIGYRDCAACCLNCSWQADRLRFGEEGYARARIRCEIFASFDPGDIDVSRTSGEGPRIFKRCLEFAKNGRIDESSPTGLEADTPFEEDVADVIRSYGFLADPQVGSAGFRIDIRVRHPDKPGTYVLAVECDGATYHSALWARERDRLRQDVLEHLGRRFHRIWSTDWFYNRKAEIERLRQALVAAREAAEKGVRIDGANKERPVAAATTKTAPRDVGGAGGRRAEDACIRAGGFPVNGAVEPDGAGRSLGGARSPDRPGRRPDPCRGARAPGCRELRQREGGIAYPRGSPGRAEARAGTGLRASVGRDVLVHRDQSEQPPVRDRSLEASATIKAASISLLEIREALRIAREDNAGGDDADLIRTAARLLGFRRVGSDLQAGLAGALE